MKFNEGKCKLMNIGFRNRKEDYGVPLGIIKEEKELGVFVSQYLKVGKQCFKAASKGNQVLGMSVRDAKCKGNQVFK